MSETLITDVLVVAEGCAGQTAALAASEEGCDVVLLGGHPRPVGFPTDERRLAQEAGGSRRGWHAALCGRAALGLRAAVPTSPKICLRRNRQAAPAGAPVHVRNR